MKQAGLYHSLIGSKEQEVPLSLSGIEEDAGRFQARQRWLESTITREHIVNIDSKYEHHIESALSLAKSSPVNHEGILRNLVSANTYLDILNMYNQENNK
jgi:hypothetical protein